MFITTTELTHIKYKIIEVVFAYGSSDSGFLKTANPMEAYPKVRDLLKNEAEKIGADAVIGAHFDYRTAVKSGCSGNQSSFEVFAYGTAIKSE